MQRGSYVIGSYGRNKLVLIKFVYETTTSAKVWVYCRVVGMIRFQLLKTICFQVVNLCCRAVECTFSIRRIVKQIDAGH